MRIRIVTEGAFNGGDAPSVTSPMAPRHLPAIRLRRRSGAGEDAAEQQGAVFRTQVRVE